ncbi:MAG: UTP--glucose-1-phosphate uridylyltransferase [Flavobacteriaceae bacterium]|nr:UTP--glucose-1-phosphate uridylyltransferase [Flavobacteriaceae bacterium]
MAAGSGSRYGKLKQFDDLGPNGEFLMEFSIYDALQQGFDHIVIITKAANQEFLKSYLSERLPDHVKLDVLVQQISDIPEGININADREKPWGTAHAVWTARNVVKSDFVIINADDYYGKAAFEGASHFMIKEESKGDYALVGYKLEDTLSDHGSVSRGVCQAENGLLVSIEEHTKIHRSNGSIVDEDSGRHLEANTIVSMNFWICNPSIFNYITDYFRKFLSDSANHEKNEIYLPFVAQEMMSNGLINIEVINAKSDWFGVTYYDDKVNAVKTLKALTDEGLYSSPLWNS